MRISDRYIGTQVFFGTLYAIVVLSLVLVLGNLFKEIRPLLVEQRAPLGLVLRFVLSVLPVSLMYTLPWGFLSAVLLVFGRLSASQEITAFRVAGVSLFRLAAPVFVLGALLSGLSLWLNLRVVPTAKASVAELLYEHVKNDPAALLDPGMVQAGFQGKKVYVEGREGNTLHGLNFYQLPEGSSGGQTAYVHARTAGLIVDQKRQQIRLRLDGAYVETKDQKGDLNLALADQVQPVIFDLPSQRSRRMRKGTMTNRQILDFLGRSPGLTEEQRVGYRAEITKRQAFSMACVAFACIAVPLGLKSRRKDSSSGLVMSLILGAGYFLFTVLADEFETDAGATAVLWAPNAICVLLGFFLFRRARFK
jgi:lipopolysaccharide export LptBFGC system permease protein LptF